MTAEQLEELLSAASNPTCEGFSLALDELMASAPSLARRVIAAEKLVEAMQYVRDKEHARINNVSKGVPVTNLIIVLMDEALTAYRESRK